MALYVNFLLFASFSTPPLFLLSSGPGYFPKTFHLSGFLPGDSLPHSVLAPFFYFVPPVPLCSLVAL